MPEHIIANEVDRSVVAQTVSELPIDSKHQYTVTIKPLNKSITGKQFRAKWVFCKLLADALNDGGFHFQLFLEKVGYKQEIDWNKDLVNQYIWHPVMEAMTGEDETQELDRPDPGKIHETIMRHLGEKIALDFIPWPKYKGDE